MSLAVNAPTFAAVQPDRSAAPDRKSRIEGFDAVRGVAMLFVCLSHFSTRYFRPETGGGIGSRLFMISMIASPTFVAVSGMMLGLLSGGSAESFDRLRIKLVDRALFMLLVGHNLIFLASLPSAGHVGEALRQSQITDMIAVCVLICVWLVRSTPRSFRVGLGLSCFAISWVLVFAWNPVGAAHELFKELLVGTLGQRELAYAVPVLPWFGVYVACTALGQHLGNLHRRGDLRGIEQTLGIGAAAALSLAVGAHVLRGIVGPVAHAQVVLWRFTPLFSPWSKLPPSPAYVAFYGGLGLGLVCATLSISHRGWVPWLRQQAATIGRCSLAVFLVQYGLYYALIGGVHPAYSPAWPLIFLASLVVILVFARYWDRHDLNRVLTVGLRAAWLRRSSGSAARIGLIPEASSPA